jgi:hypothetical protein
MGVVICPVTEEVTVAAQEQETVDFTLTAREIVCGFVEGTVTCNDGNPVTGAIVKVFNDTDAHFGITNADGFYAICVPEGTYTVTVFCCPSGCCVDASCPTCGCGTCPSPSNNS